MTTKAEDVRAMAKAHRENGWPHTDTSEVLEAYADLIDQQAKGEPYGYVYSCPHEDACFEYKADRWVTVGIHTEIPVYLHPSPAQAEPVKKPSAWMTC
jgi:hypothetical protein